MRRCAPWLFLGLALLPAACAPPPPGPGPGAEGPATGGVRAIDAARGRLMPEYGRPGDDTGTFGGQQLPNVSRAPRL
jgi:hypothetical protein